MQQRTKRIVTLSAVVLAVAALAASVAAYLWWNGGRAQRQGVASIPGLAGPVEVRWDARAVPYVKAASGQDLAAALGWLHANDRLTQMELGRRFAFGRLSEVVGARALPADRNSRTLRLGETAERLWQDAGPDTRDWLTAYARGVNAWLAQRGDDLPPDLRLLAGRDFRPEPWRPQDSLGFVLLMAQDLSFWDGRPEEAHLQWLNALGVERTLDLAPDGTFLPAALRSLAEERAEPPAEDVLPGDLPAEGSPGSNNWAAGTSRTAGPAPVLANDPHLPFRLPGTWFQARLEAPDYDVAGMTIPGVPGVVIGRNRDLAWALTNVMLDDHDLFLEHVEETPEGPQVRRGDGWLPVEVEEQVIAVRDGEPVTLELRRTDHGPLLPAEPERGLPARSLAWTLYEPADPLSAFLALGRATLLEEVAEGIGGYVGPAQNLVVAHRDGGLLWTVLGRIPLRRQGDGWFPSPGWQEGFGWEGLRPLEGNPRVLRPPSDLLVTANNDLLAGDAPVAGSDLAFAPMPSAYDTSHRARRIRQLLEERRDWAPQDMARLQTDVVDLYALEVVEAALGGLERQLDLSDESTERVLYAALLESWDGRMTVEDATEDDRRSYAAAAFFALFERELRRGIFGDEAAAHGLERFDDREALVRVLSGDLSAEWFDDVSTPERETRLDVVVAALDSAVAAATDRWSRYPDDWHYGELHTLVQPHPLGTVPVLGSLFQASPRPAPGSATTVAAFGARWTADGDLRVTYGPSMRWATALEDPDRSLAILPSGQAGHPADRHYDDQLDDYLAGVVHPFPWSGPAVEGATVSRLRLDPATGAPAVATPGLASVDPQSSPPPPIPPSPEATVPSEEDRP